MSAAIETIISQPTGHAAPRSTSGSPPSRVRVAYMMSRFPKLTETFILYEMLAVEQQGVEVELFPLQRERTSVMHAEARTFMQRAHFTPWLSLAIIVANWRTFCRQPLRYLATLAAALRATWGSLRYFFGILAFFPKAVYLAEQMQRRGITHLHAHFASHPAAVALIIHQLAGIPYSFTAHGSDLHRDVHMLPEKVASAEFVAAISEYNRELIVRECQGRFAEKVQVIHCGVDTRLFRPTESFGSKSDALQIGCIGTLHEVKGQRYLLEACAILAADRLPFTLHVVGDGPDRRSLEQQAARLGLSRQTVFHGRRTRDEILDLLGQWDVLVAPSVPTRDGRREGIPVVLMEAMASGVPVVSSRLSGIPELVQPGTGLLAEPGDSAALAKAIAQLHRSPDYRHRLGQAGRARVEAEFDLHRNARHLAQRIAAAAAPVRRESAAQLAAPEVNL